MSGVLVVGALVGAAFDVSRFLAAGVVLWLFGCAIAGVTSLVAVVTLSRGTAAAVSAGILITMYLLNIVAQVQPSLDWLGGLSAFRYTAVGQLIDRGTIDWIGMGAFAIVAIVGWGAAIVLFRRRDLLP